MSGDSGLPNGFWAMDGYGWFVWPSYALAVGVVILLAARAWARHRDAKRRLAELEREGAS
jgi:heme exporter protein CcmD